MMSGARGATETAYGHSDIKQLAAEILGLSKMNWNTFDLYTKLPATVQSSNEIARIGSLPGSFQPKACDFRLFIYVWMESRGQVHRRVAVGEILNCKISALGLSDQL